MGEGESPHRLTGRRVTNHQSLLGGNEPSSVTTSGQLYANQLGQEQIFTWYCDDKIHSLTCSDKLGRVHGFHLSSYNSQTLHVRLIGLSRISTWRWFRCIHLDK